MRAATKPRPTAREKRRAKSELGRWPEASKKRAIRIRQLLLAHELTQAQIAREVECTVSYITNNIRGEMNVRWVREYLARRLGVAYDDLWALEVGLDHPTPADATTTSKRSLGTRGAKRDV